MKKIILLMAIFLTFFTSCKKDDVEYRWDYRGVINSVKVDDDGEYHVNTDYTSLKDLSHIFITIERANIKQPMLYCKQNRCKSGTCWDCSDEWQDEFYDYKLKLPYDYKIEIFND